MSFLSYLTRIPRHFDNQPNVLSTTQRRGFSPLELSQDCFSSPIRRMCGVYEASVVAFSAVGLSKALSKHRCCGCSSVGSGRSMTIASIVASKSFCSTTLAPAVTTPSGPPSPSVRRFFLVPFWPRSVGFLPVFFPPEPGLAQHRIRRLPLPLHAAEFVTLGGQDRPDPLHDPRIGPTLKPVVDGALGPESLGQLVPLAAAAHPEDDRVEHRSPIGDLPSGRLLGPELRENGLDPLPQLIGDFPNRTQRLASRFPAGHDSDSCCRDQEWCSRYKLLCAKGVPAVLG